jgi:hypothetical protein
MQTGDYLNRMGSSDSDKEPRKGDGQDPLQRRSSPSNRTLQVIARRSDEELKKHSIVVPTSQQRTTNTKIFEHAKDRLTRPCRDRTITSVS